MLIKGSLGSRNYGLTVLDKDEDVLWLGLRFFVNDYFNTGLHINNNSSSSCKVNVDLYSASTQTPLTRSDMDHTVLPANNTISAFTPLSQSITAL